MLKKLFTLLLIVCLSGKALLAAGGRTGELLNWGAGARSLAMGKAYTAVADDGSAGYWNAAGMTQSDKKELSMLHTSLWEGTVYDFLGLVYPTVSRGTWGISTLRLTSGKAEKRDTENIIAGSFQNRESAYLLSYGYSPFSQFSVGSSLKKFDSNLDGHSNGHFGLDINVLYKIVGNNRYFNNLRLGGNLQNIFAQKNSANTEDRLPLGIRLGAAAILLSNKLLLSLDVENRLGSELVYHLGGEYRFKHFAIRLGSDREEYTAGFGLNYKDYALDYAYAAHTLGDSQRLGLSYKFGMSVGRQREGKAAGFYQEAITLASEGAFKPALPKLAAAARYRESKENLLAFSRLSEVTMYIGLAKEETKDHQELRKGVVDYLAGNDQKALDEVLYAFSLNREETKKEQFYNLLRQMEKTTGLKAKQEEIAGNWNLVEQRLYKSLRYFREKQFDLAVVECQEAIKLEPTNILAYKRLGSAFYALDKRAEARQAWQKAIDLSPPNDPGNDKLKTLVNSIGDVVK